MAYEVLISPGCDRQRWKKILLILVLLGLILLGRAVTPVVGSRSKMLTPRLSAITRYQRSARRWITELGTIQVRLSDLLSISNTDLLSQVQQLDRLKGELEVLSTEVESQRIPAGGESVQASIQTLIQKTGQACADTAAWLSEPTEANFSKASQTIGAIQESLESLEQNPWIHQP